jgi:hypothetical protein
MLRKPQIIGARMPDAELYISGASVSAPASFDSFNPFID